MSEYYTILVLCDEVTPRLRYVVDHVFGLAGIDQVLMTNRAPRTTNADIVISYGVSTSFAHITIPAHGLMSEVGIAPQTIDVHQQDDLPYFFASQAEESGFDFDLFSLIFYLLSRYEEYGNVGVDKHGRYKSEQSVAVRSGFLNRPIIDLWIQRFFQKINNMAGTRIKIQGHSKNQPSIDIDMPYAYRYKGYKAYAGVLRDFTSGSLSSVAARMNYWLTEKDPFDTYDYLAQSLGTSVTAPYFFILNRYHPPFDENHLALSPQLKPILDQLQTIGKLGIHPSIRSHEDPNYLKEEVDHLASLTSLANISRQHFIKLAMPKAYRHLVALGIESDHSMIYPDRIGFRASTSHPYRWYDISAEKVTDLIIHPYIVMDVTLRYYLKMSPASSIDSINQLQEEVQAVNGSFGWLWHNSSLSQAYGWAPWKQVYEHLTLL